MPIFTKILFGRFNLEVHKPQPMKYYSAGMLQTIETGAYKIYELAPMEIKWN
jgi:hypothetical protein